MEVYLNDKKIKVIIVRKKIKNIYFRFNEESNLIVSANAFVSEKEILKLLNKNSDSLSRMLEKWMKKQEKSKEFWYLGNKYDIIFDENKRDIDFQNGVIICQNANTLNKFIKKQIEVIFNDEVNNLRKVIKTPNFTLKIRKMKTRWGVCNYKLNTITLNSELIRYSKENLRYVIVHEMCHFYHHNHGPLFWEMVSKYYPNYKKTRKELKY